MIVRYLHIRNVTDEAKVYPEADNTDINRRNKPEYARVNGYQNPLSVFC